MKKILLYAAAVVLAMVVLIPIGCETESASTNNVRVTPASATVQNGQSVQFTASGGYEYTWSLATASYGTLSTREGSTTVYTSRYAANTNSSSSNSVPQTLYVTSTISGHGDTNTTYSMRAEAYIRHI